jgi:hypothetical protein
VAPEAPRSGPLGSRRPENRIVSQPVLQARVGGGGYRRTGRRFGIGSAGLWTEWRMVFWGGLPEACGFGRGGETNPGLFNIMPLYDKED